MSERTKPALLERQHRRRCVRCGYCATEDLSQVQPIVVDTGQRTFERCEVCRDQTTHRIERLPERVD